jgi:hypothetical protein
VSWHAIRDRNIAISSIEKDWLEAAESLIGKQKPWFELGWES